MTPAKGMRVALRFFLFDEALGSDLQYFCREATARTDPVKNGI